MEQTGRGGRCAFAILPPGEEHAARVLRSLEAAQEFGLGDFSEVAVLPTRSGSPQEVLGEAVETAKGRRFDWLLAVSSAEMLAPDIFVKAAPALRVYDAIWGGAGLSEVFRQPAPPKPEKITRLAAQDLPAFFHAALAWWIGPTHFVRPAAALAALQNADGEAWYADYLVALWRNARAYKTAQVLTFFSDAVPPVPEMDRARLIKILEREPAFMNVRHGPRTLRLPYTGVNPVIEREQMRGLFFEHEELEFLASRLPRGMRVVDAGANTGNHTLFFGAVLEAGIVVPIEPDPRAAAALRAAVAENALINVDVSHLGVALGSEEGRLRAVHSAAGGLGATRFIPDPQGDTPVLPLDALAPRLGHGAIDFVKIDVEGMELAVLRGAAALIRRDRPYLHVEVLDEGIAEFLAWVDANGYQVEKLFPDKTHCNYFLAPKDRA